MRVVASRGGGFYEATGNAVNESGLRSGPLPGSRAGRVGVMRIAVLGAGAWGMTLALLSHASGNGTTLICRRPELAEHLRSQRRHPTSLRDVVIPSGIAITADGEPTISDADIVILATPAQRLRSAISPLQAGLRGKIVVSGAKGLEAGTLLRPTQVIEEVLAAAAGTGICALSGPNLANEVAHGKPAAAVVAGDAAVAGIVQRAISTTRFRVYVGEDVIGVEMGGALKNIIAIGAGIGDGLAAGNNAKAAFLTRGIAEIARLGVAAGAQPLTFAGLSGIGDLIATCSSPLSRNHTVGRELAKGRNLDDILASMSEVAEGVPTTRAAFALGERLGVELPIIEQMHHVLFEGRSPMAAVSSLMERDPGPELSGLASS